MTGPVVIPRSALPARESLRVEFKRDPAPGGLSDGELVAAVICLANTEGGDLYLGINDDGVVSGVVPGRDVTRIAAAVANRTTPRVVAEVEMLNVGGTDVIHVRVPRMPSTVMRTDGLYQRRLIKADGTPECVGMQPQEVSIRQSDPLRADGSADVVLEADLSDLDATERARMRRIIEEQPNADKRLLDMDAETFDDTLHLSADVDGRRVPTLTGLLLLGSPRALHRHVPFHQVAIQVFRGTEVTVNRIEQVALLSVLDDLDRQFATLPAEGELAVGLRRLPIPSVDADAFRETVLNAFAHRDYRRLGKVRVAFKDDELEVSSPGGLVAGVTVNRLLTTPPVHRNATLVNALTRLGLVEQSARGVDRIFEGQVRYGRPVPDYRDTTPELVLVRLSRARADRAFHAALLDLERDLEAKSTQQVLPIPSLRRGRLPVEWIIVLAALRRERRLTLAELAEALQRPEDNARRLLSEIESAGLVVPHGRTRARFYLLGARFLNLLNSDESATAAAGLPSVRQQEEAILSYAGAHGAIRRADVTRLLPLTEEQATDRLVAMATKEMLIRQGVGRGTFYVLPPHQRNGAGGGNGSNSP